MPKICPYMSTMVKVSGYEEFLQKNCIENLCQVWDDANQRCGTLNSDINIHAHNSHEHPKAHSCYASKNILTGFFRNECGGYIYNQLIARSTILLNEFMFGSDMDGNGLIYGNDFMIIGENKPPILEQIEHMEQWEDSSCKITWQQYQDWIDNPDDSQYNPFLNGVCGP